MGVRRPYCPCRDTTQRCVYDVLEVFKKARSQGRDVHSFAVEVSDAVLRRLSQSKQFSIVDVGIRAMVAINAATGRCADAWSAGGTVFEMVHRFRAAEMALAIALAYGLRVALACGALPIITLQDFTARIEKGLCLSQVHAPQPMPTVRSYEVVVSSCAFFDCNLDVRSLCPACLAHLQRCLSQVHAAQPVSKPFPAPRAAARASSAGAAQDSRRGDK